MAQDLGEKQWYIVNTISMHEAKTAENLRRRIVSMNMEDYILRVLVAEVDVQEMKDGVPTGKTKKKNLYPGYLFVEMIMTDQSWYVVRNTPGVTGIAGSSGGGQKPTPVSQEEMEPVLKRMGEIDNSMFDRYHVGDSVRIISGPLEGTEGKIVSIDKDTHQCRVETVFFGRTTPADVDFSEIEKL